MGSFFFNVIVPVFLLTDTHTHTMGQANGSPEEFHVGTFVCVDGPGFLAGDHPGTCGRCTGWRLVEDRVSPGKPPPELLRNVLPSHLWDTHVRIVQSLLSPPMLCRTGRPCETLNPGLRCIGWAGSNLWLGGTMLYLIRHHDVWQGCVRFLTGRRVDGRPSAVYTCRLSGTAEGVGLVNASFLYHLLREFRDFASTTPLDPRKKKGVAGDGQPTALPVWGGPCANRSRGPRVSQTPDGGESTGLGRRNL